MGPLPDRALAPFVVAPLVAIADRVLLRIVEDRVAGKLQEAVGFRHKPDVSIKGFPFLTQAVSKHFSEVHVVGRGLARGALPVSRLGMILYGVRPQGGGRVHVDGLGGTALIAFADLARLSGRRLVTLAAGDDQVEITATTSGTLGPTSPLEIRATSRIALTDGNRLQVKVVKVDRLPPGLNRTVAELLDFTVPVIGLPLGLTLVGARVVSEGVELKLSGRKTVLAGPPD
jgi:hypothetical protein